MGREWAAMLGALSVGAALAQAQVPPQVQRSAPRWHISGMLAEACTCSPPCTCNFGMKASPHDFCYSIFSYGIKDGEYDGVKLDGLTFTCAKAQGAYVWYIDRRATPEQADALRAIAERIIPLQRPGRKRGRRAQAILSAGITQEVTERGSRVAIEGAGGFDSTYLIGLDGQTPIVELNNTTFNLKRSMKGRTGTFRYEDHFGNKIDCQGTNSNTGEFEYDQDTRKFLG